MKKYTQRIKRKRYGGSNRISRTRRRKRKSPERCAICQESLHNGKKLYKTVCYHRFHKICLQQSCRHNNVCPICRNNIFIDCEDLALSDEDIENALTYNALHDWPNKDEMLEKWRIELRSLSFDPKYQYNWKPPINTLFFQAVDMIQRWDGDGPLVNPYYYEED
jgi:hypothetical protein